MKKYHKLWGLIIGFVCLLTSISVEAESTDIGIGFSYQNILPSNQLSEGNYFDVSVAPKEKQVLVTEVTNLSSQEIIIQIELNDASTTSNGEINYNKGNQKSSQHYQLNDLISFPSEISLRVGETKTIDYVLTAPEQPIKGVLLGGVQLRQKNKAEQEKQGTINNEYAYLFSLSIRSDERVIPHKLAITNSTDKIKSQEKTFFLPIANQRPNLIKEMEIETRLKSEMSKKIIRKTKQQGLKMAPLSTLDFPFNYSDLAIGNYQLSTTATIGKEKWRWITQFELNAEGQLTDKIVTKESKKNANVSYFWLFSGGIIVTLICGVFANKCSVAINKNGSQLGKPTMDLPGLKIRGVVRKTNKK